jgi:hypothetical protein
MVPVSRIWVESPEDRFSREEQAGRPPRDIARDRQWAGIMRARRAETRRLRAEEAAELEHERSMAEMDAERAKNSRRFHSTALSNLVQHRREIEDYMRAGVEQAREDGVSWTVIGDALGVSKQAARKRFRDL